MINRLRRLDASAAPARTFGGDRPAGWADATLESWRRYEAAEPDISTERLMAMVRGDTGAEPDRQVEALQRAGMLRRN